MIRRVWHWFIGPPQRPRVVIQGYGQAFKTDQGKYDREQVETFCADLEAAGIDQILWPAGLTGVYDDGHGNLMRLGE